MRRKMLFAACLYMIAAAAAGTWLLLGSVLTYGPFFRYFTNLSNLLAGGVSLLILISLLRKKPLSRHLTLAMLAASSAVTLTLLTVAVFLGPITVLQGGDYLSMFRGPLLLFHFLTPAAAFVTFSFLMKSQRLLKRDVLFGLLPTFVYGAVYAFMIIRGNWPDFYHFTFGGRYALAPLVFAVMLGVSLGISALLVKLHNLRKE